MFEKLKNNSGESYTGIIVMVLVAVMVILVAIGTFSLVVQKVNLDHFAREMVRTVEVSGRIGTEVSIRYQELQNETGLSPTLVWDTVYFDQANKSIQLRGDITLFLELKSSLKAFGGITPIPVTLKSKATGKSERYWK